MLKDLVEQAGNTIGSYKELAERLNTYPFIISEWKAGRRKPTPYNICYMAEIVGLNPLETLAEIQAELDIENASYWKKWCARRESNPRPLVSETNTLSN